MFLTFQFNVHTFIHYTTQLKQPKEQSKHLHFMFNYFLMATILIKTINIKLQHLYYIEIR